MENRTQEMPEKDPAQQDYRLFKREELKFPFCGLERNELGENNIARLENGRKTDVLTFKFKDSNAESGYREVTGRANLYRRDDALHVKVIEKRESLFIASGMLEQLSAQEASRLQNEKLSSEYRWIFKDKLTNEAGKSIENVFIFPDTQTNNLVFVDANKIRPGKIRGTELTEKQLEALRNGATLELTLKAAGNEKKYQGEVRLDPSALIKDMDSSFVQIRVSERKRMEDVVNQEALTNTPAQQSLTASQTIRGEEAQGTAVEGDRPDRSRNRR